MLTPRDDSTFGGSGPLLVAYRFKDSRSGDDICGYGTTRQVDDYTAYNQLVHKQGGNAASRLHYFVLAD